MDLLTAAQLLYPAPMTQFLQAVGLKSPLKDQDQDDDVKLPKGILLKPEFISSSQESLVRSNLFEQKRLIAAAALNKIYC